MTFYMSLQPTPSLVIGIDLMQFRLAVLCHQGICATTAVVFFSQMLMSPITADLRHYQMIRKCNESSVAAGLLGLSSAN